MAKLSTARQDALNDAFRIYGDNPARLEDFINWVNASHNQALKNKEIK